MEKTSYYLGIDLDNDNAVISYFQLNMKEPETVSTVAGSEVYQIPLILAKKHGIGQWFIGEEAKHLALLQGEEAVSGLLQAALAGKEFFIEGETYKAQELLALYIKKLVYLAGKLGNPVIPDFLVITLEQLSREVTELFLQVAERVFIISHSASKKNYGCMMCVCLTTGEMRSGAGDWNGIKEPCRSLSRSVRNSGI